MARASKPKRRRTDSARLDGAKVARLRHDLGYKQQSLADRAGLSKRTIENAEAGRPLRARSAGELANALGARLEDLLAESRGGVSGGGRPRSPLEAQIGSFAALVGERTRGFVGRRFLFEKLQKYLAGAEGEAGYFLIRGGPGVGKSAILSRLVHERKYIHHFNVALQGIDTAEQFLESVCAQLIVRFSLPFDALPPSATRDGRFLNMLLGQAASRRRGRQPIVVAIDALDEVDLSDHPTGANVLFLPTHLPHGVFCVATTRPVDLPLEVAHARTFDLEFHSPENRGDLREFLLRQARLKAIGRWLTTTGLTAEKFVDLLDAKSQGNFLYARRVTRAIAQGFYDDRLPDELPEGLKAYYRGHWERMRRSAGEAFEATHLPLIRALTQSDEPLILTRLAAAAGVKEEAARRVLRDWRSFFFEEPDSSGVPTYRLYHDTFGEFLREEALED